METTTKIGSKKTSSNDDPQEVKNVIDSSPTTPTASSSWWGGFISHAKEKSASVLQAVKNDLDEITTAVTETFHLTPAEEDAGLESSAETQSQKQLQQLQQQQQQQNPSTVSYMKQSLSSFFGTVTDALIPQLDEEDTTEAVLITSDDTIVLTGFRKYLAELQSNDETYLEEPSKTADLAEKYRMWLEIVEQDQFTQQRVDKMLQSSQILNEKYNKFVPDTVSHMNFFKRYLFKKALLEDDLANEERRRKEEAVIQKQPESVSVVEPQKEEEISEAVVMPVIPADIGDLEIANFELSEEEQARLLSDYEQEIKEREKSKTETTKSPAKPAMKTKNQPKTTSNVQSSKGKNNKNVKFQQQQKSTQQQTSVKTTEKTKKSGELKVESNHFKKEVDSSSTSDESWEKEFDL